MKEIWKNAKLLDDQDPSTLVLWKLSETQFELDT